MTHYSEKNSDKISSEEVTERLKNSTNIIKFTKPAPIEFYSTTKRNKSVEVDINIELVNYKLSAKLFDIIQTHVNGMYKLYVSWFGWNPRPGVPITIKIFGQYKDFERYQVDNRQGSVVTRSHYSPRHREVLMLGTEFADSTLGLLFHETSHAIMHMEMRYIPKWINEGLAEVFRGIYVKGRNMSLGYNAAWVEITQHMIREGSLRSFKDYINISNQEWSRESARVERSYYIIAWAMMRFLTSTQHGVDTLRKTLMNTQRQAWWKQGRLEAMFTDHYPGGIDQLDGDMRAWIRSFKL